MSKAYKFKKEDGKLVITHETNEFNLFRIQTIHGPYIPKGRKTDFDVVTDYDGNVVLVKRKDLLKFDVLHSFIFCDKFGTRSEQYNPWYEYPCELEPHGGITFSGFRPHVGGNDATNYIWWLGFDCAHLGDGYDIESARKYFPHYSNLLMLSSEDDHIWTFDDVLQELLRWLVDIMEWVDKEKVESKSAITDAWLYDGRGPMKCSRCGYESNGPIKDTICPECGVRLWGVRTI